MKEKNGAMATNLLDNEKILVQLTKTLAIKNGSIFDIVDIPLMASDFSFFYRILGAYHQEKRCEQSGGWHEIALLSTLVYLSSKVHFYISEQTGSEEYNRKMMRFPILVGDLLYGNFCAEIVKGRYNKHLEDYIDFLMDCNAAITKFIGMSKNNPDVFWAEQLENLTQLSIKILDPARLKTDLENVNLICKVKYGLDDGVMLQPVWQDVMKTLKTEGSYMISTISDLQSYLKIE